MRPIIRINGGLRGPKQRERCEGTQQGEEDSKRNTSWKSESVEKIFKEVLRPQGTSGMANSICLPSGSGIPPKEGCELGRTQKQSVAHPQGVSWTWRGDIKGGTGMIGVL